MSFAVHTEKLNLISAVASEVNDEKHDAKIQQSKRLKAQTQVTNGNHSASTTTSTAIGTDNDDKDTDNRNNSNPHINTQSLQSRMYELECLLRLAIPTLIIQLGSVIPGFTVASYIGRTFSNVTYLAGFTLASVTANLFTLSLLQGLYTASDTLSPQAYGAGNMKEVGYLAIRGFIASMMVVLPIILLLIIYMKPMLLWIGEDSESATHACVWFRIYACSIPFYALYQVSMKFLSAQNQMQPLVVCCILSSCIVLPLSLYVFGNLYGFIGTAIAIVVYQLFQSVSLIVYIWLFQSHDPLTWPGLQDGVRNALQLKPFMSYMVRTFRNYTWLKFTMRI
jgi:Na+-driven multidrug efflux pump